MTKPTDIGDLASVPEDQRENVDRRDQDQDLPDDDGVEEMLAAMLEDAGEVVPEEDLL